MMKKVLDFVKKHKLCSVFMAPGVLFLVMLVIGVLYWFLLTLGDVFYRIPALAPGKVSETYIGLLSLSFLLIVLVYPPVLTVLNFYFILDKEHLPFQTFISTLSEVATILLGVLFSWLYISAVTSIVFVDWPKVLYNSQVHSPIATWTFPTIVVMAGIGILGYIILRMIPLKELPPLVVVLSMSAMYIGCLMCVLWTVQTWVRLEPYLFLFPINCILIAAKVIRRILRQWQDLHPQEEREEPVQHCAINGDIAPAVNIRTMPAKILRNSRNWPWLALILMLPLLGILIMILMLFGQKPDSVIRAWTETSQWTLSQKVSPQNVMLDDHYLCTVAAGGHPCIVHPIRLGVRHGHKIIVNRQLCVANAFEQILMERVPKLHRLIRGLYDRLGFPLARCIRTALAADLVYIMMKPLEWIFLAVIYLCDVHPESRIAMQYIPPVESGTKS